MKIKTKFLLIILLTGFSFIASLSVYLLLTSYVMNINHEKNRLTELEDSIQQARMTGSGIFMDNPLISSWNAFLIEYENVQADFEAIDTLKYLPRINKSLKESLTVISGLYSYVAEKYEKAVAIYDELILVLQDVEYLNISDIRLTDIYIEYYVRNSDRIAYTYYLTDTLQTECTHMDYILNSALETIALQMSVIESESRERQHKIVFVSILLCFLLVTVSVLFSLMIARRIVEDTKKINRSLFKMIESKEPVSIGIDRKDELGVLAHNMEEIFKQMLEMKDHLVQQEKMASLGHLIAGVAHEINTPLGSSVTLSSYLKKETELLEERFLNKILSQKDFEDYLQHSRESHRLLMINLNRTVDLIQSFKALTIDKSSQDRLWVDLNQYVKDVVFSLKALSMKNHIQMDIDFSDPIKLYCLPGDFSQVLTQLVQNSISHGFKGDRKGSIKISFRKIPGDSILVHYRDDGEGMSGEVLKKAFDPFFTTNRGADGGIGLGLYIVFNLISHVFKGTITCTSRIGKGTEFTIRLPVNPLDGSMPSLS